MKIKIPIRLINIEGDGYHLAVKLHINGKPANAILDTGASKTVFDLAQIGRFLGEEKISSNERVSTGLGTSNMQSQFVVLNKVSIGKLHLENYPAVVLDLGHVNMAYHALGLEMIDGVLGSDILQAYHAVIDYKKKTLTIETAKRRTKKKKRSAAGRKRSSRKSGNKVF